MLARIQGTLTGKGPYLLVQKKHFPFAHAFEVFSGLPRRLWGRLGPKSVSYQLSVRKKKGPTKGKTKGRDFQVRPNTWRVKLGDRAGSIFWGRPENEGSNQGCR